MKQTWERKCRHCKELFRPDPRNRRTQKVCSEEPCRRAGKAIRQRLWLKKPENRDYFRGPTNVERVRAWRERTPEYWKRGGQKPAIALQDALKAQDAEILEESVGFALQDVLTNQPLVLIGLIAQITGTTLQDDIAKTTQELLRLALDIVGSKESGHGEKRNSECGAGPPHTEAV